MRSWPSQSRIETKLQKPSRAKSSFGGNGWVSVRGDGSKSRSYWSEQKIQTITVWIFYIMKAVST